MACKHLFIGYFNFNHSCYIERCHAYSERQAWLILCRRIAKKQRVTPQMTMNYFDGSRPNYEIKKEIEYQEVDSTDID